MEKSIQQQIVEKRAELKALEQHMKSESIGKVVYITGRGFYDDVPVGSLGRVSEVYDTDDESDYEIKVYSIDDSDWDSFRFADVIFVDRDEARKLLYELADEVIDRAFGDDA